jgi:hypothetical protein
MSSEIWVDLKDELYKFLKTHTDKKYSVKELSDIFLCEPQRVRKALIQLKYRGMASMTMRDRKTLWFYSKSDEDWRDNY